MATSNLKLGSYQYDTNEQQLFDPDNQKCTLRHQSHCVLHQLALHPNKVVSKTALFTNIWKGVSVTDDSLVQCIADIRRALQDHKHEILKTIPRRGYLLVAEEVIESPISSLPEDLLPFLGREQELQELRDMLTNPVCRFISIVGIGGMGKSRLAKTLARQVSAQFVEGIFFIELASVQCPELIPATIANAIGIPIQGARTPTEQLKTALASRQILLVLDNVEHLLEDLTICQILLEHNPNLKILITSRLPLHLYGEWIYRLQGLKLPDIGQQAQHCAALDLFLQSAQRIHHGFCTDTHSQAVIIDICRLVDGMPLGIEIAASWVVHLSCPEILAEMHRHLQKPAIDTAQPSDRNALTNVLAQSWQMLTPREQQIMQALALFRGKFTREAASAIAGAELADYSGLIGKSMLSRTQSGHYSLHEVMRQYANNHRLSTERHIPTAISFVEYHLDIAETVDKVIFGGQQLAGIARMESEHDNFRQCLSLCNPNASGYAGMPELGLRLVGSIGMFWFLANHWKEGYSWTERFLSIQYQAPPSSAKAAALLTVGSISFLMDDHEAAEKYLNTGTEMAHQLGDHLLSARGLLALSVFRRLQSRYVEAISYGQHSMRLFTDLGDQGGYQFNLVNTGHSLLGMGRYDEAINTLEECIRLNQQIGMTISVPYALVNLGRLHWKQQQATTARLYLQQSITVAKQFGTLLYHAQALCTLGWIELTDGNVQLALQYFRDSMTDYMHLGDREGQADVMKGIGVAKTLLGDLPKAWQFIVAAEDLIEHLKIPVLFDNPELLLDSKQKIQKSINPNELDLYKNIGRSLNLNDLFGMLT